MNTVNLNLAHKQELLRWATAQKVASVIHLIIAGVTIIGSFFPSIHSLLIYINACGYGAFLVLNAIYIRRRKTIDRSMIEQALSRNKNTKSAKGAEKKN